ncbi:type I restriction endonuclease subunit R [Phycisphaera mikurensis]|uniref:Type I restriction enzyme endonuclease subunit n=1 Tax=Phycisphaera mikurensis (strain NBRC 102666 / KCTC 22515 / FYK2301M01) TaxID=1142394 RepID=I0II65_PHYMF|nr:type I restriction endonuclease subunit R [Phycisphaera mikurensis]MBB6442484.1 type I restriction enzyme R subunit [Phycisphaera mikurensis]BAM04953.1 type I restriction-modification system restriction subunit [Phycisphaera mikurensis NBRC 102666]
MINEDAVEQKALRWFQDTGWAYLHGSELAPDVAPEQRADGKAVVLAGRLAEAVRRLNPQLPAEAVEEVVRAATQREHPDLARANAAFHRRMIDGVPVRFEDPSTGEKVQDVARLVDFGGAANNDWLVVNQLAIAGTKDGRRPDVIAYLNGLPIAVIELKNPADEKADVWAAYRQLQTYKDEIGELFVRNAALVVSDGITARVGSLTASPEWFLPWRAVSGEADQPKVEMELERVVRGFFRPDLLLDYLRHFILFEGEEDVVKKIAGYHQFHGVRAAVEATVVAADRGVETAPGDAVRERPAADWGRRVPRGSGKAGVFWHTQGSGKSISMAMYAGKLMQQPAMNNPTLVVVTDRLDLDGQLFAQFAAAKSLLGEKPDQAESREQLRDYLDGRASGGIVFTTVQKFAPLDGEEAHPVLSGRSNVVVISDEAHRSQYGIKPTLDRKTGRYVYGYAKHLRDALSGASFIGFTGTPISSEDRDTRGVFGEYVSVYDIADAVEDGATVQIYYESRRAKLDLNDAEIETLNQQVDEVVEDEETEDRERTKGHWAQLAKLVGARPRLEAIADDLLAHFDQRKEAMASQVGPDGGKAMIVTMSRDICVALFDEIVRRRPEMAGSRKDDGTWNPEDGSIRVVMTGTATDRVELRHHQHGKAQRERLAKRFKDPADPLELVIVRDMWLTGFDAPCCHTMYVDKPMRGHALMQAIARVNRVFREKAGGLVVDYIGIANELKQALKTYTESKGRGQPTVRAEDGLRILKEKVGVLRDMMRENGGFAYAGFETQPLELLPGVTNHLLGLDDGKRRFLDVMASVLKAFSLCATLDEAAALRTEIAFFSAVRGVLAKHGQEEPKRGGADKSASLKLILDNAVVSEGVDDIFAMAGLERPDIGLLSEGFLEDVRRMPAKNLAVELLERLIRDEIRGRSRNNVVRESRYGERLAETLRRYNNRAIESGAVVEELIAMARDFAEAVRRDEDLGLSPDEIAFYEALAERPEVLREMGDETLKALAVELTAKLRASTTVDWRVRESVRARMRLLIKRLLRKHRYPPAGQERAVDVVIAQAERLSEGWSAAG